MFSEGITHGVVVWFLIGSLLGVMLFIKLYLREVLIPATLETSEIVLPIIPLTSSQVAYDAYLNGIDHGLDGDHERSIAQHTRAVEEDPEFSIAWAALSQAHSAMYFVGTDPTEQRLTLARNTVDRAFQLDADLPEAHLALAYVYYRGSSDYERALEELAIAEPHFPGNVNLLKTRAFMYRSIGEWNAALYELERASEIEPENVELLEEQALTHLLRRDYLIAESFMDKALEQVPEYEPAQIQKAMIRLHRDGDSSSLAVAGRSFLGSGRPWMSWLAAFIQRDYAAARQALDETASNTLVWEEGYMPKPLAYGLTQHWAGNFEIAQLYFQDAREILEQDLETDLENPDLLIALGEALAYLGAQQSAVRMARRVIEVPPVSNDLFSAPRYRLSAARVLAAAGDYEGAIAELETYLSSPGRYSLNGVLSDPRFDVLLDKPGFPGLINRHR